MHVVFTRTIYGYARALKRAGTFLARVVHPRKPPKYLALSPTCMYIVADQYSISMHHYAHTEQ